MDIEVNVEPSYCELCGSDWPSVSVEFVGPHWSGRSEIGCYGGSAFEGDREGVIHWLRDECASMVDAKVLATAIQHLRAA